MGTFEKPISKPLLLDSLCWYLGSLLNSLLLKSGFGLVLYFEGQQGNSLSSLLVLKKVKGNYL